MNNKIVLLVMAGVFTGVSFFLPFFLIAVAIAVITFAMVIYIEFMREKKLDTDALNSVSKRLAELEEKHNKLSTKLLAKFGA